MAHQSTDGDNSPIDHEADLTAENNRLRGLLGDALACLTGEKKPTDELLLALRGAAEIYVPEVVSQVEPPSKAIEGCCPRDGSPCESAGSGERCCAECYDVGAL